MKRYQHLPIGGKILAGFLLVAGLTGASGIVTAGSIWDVSRRAEAMYSGNLVPLSQLPEVVKGYQTSLYLLRDIVIDRSEQERQEHLALLKQSADQVDRGLASFFAVNRSAEAVALQQSITEDLKLYGFFRDKIVDLAAQGRQDEAINIMRNQGGDVISKVDEEIAKAIAINKAQAKKRHADNESASVQALAFSALCLSLGVAAAVLVGYFMSRGITRPLRAIAGKVAEIAEGDLTARIATGDDGGTSRNELHLLAHHVNGMAETLHGVASGIVRQSGKLAAASGELNGTSSLMARQALTARGEIDTVASSGEELNQTASEIARNCGMAADNVSVANGAVDRARGVMGETLASMRLIGDHARETSGLVGELGKRSLQIGEITETIDDIADQTNLLALNAAIEAARAGEQGRGFAVVADEVRALASRTTAATREISQMIKSIQAETRRAVEAMGRGVVEAEQGVGKAQLTGEALEAVIRSIGAISVEVSQIATAAEEQSSSVYGMTGNIRQVNGVIRESEAGIQQFAAAAAQMHLVAEDLEKMSSRFTLEQTAGKPRDLGEAPMAWLGGVPAASLGALPG
ncbi:methyl-accepting chemotaxis protein [Citrifermentans bremense]|uniref:methyl-accepting chemotaxis protein n=1 Tax=Citrifermentans bremense TaxID=60035 RepID=UPI000416D86D|nr:methyl-accepting chemotaxis protein [Citrifermentans bremense]